MEYLEESIEKLREVNELEKQEISSYLDQLVQVQDHKRNSFICNSPSDSNFITELCKYEQQINHKLTEIKCELKKFIYLNKPPICKPTKRKSEVDPIDIETLKQSSWRLISKLEEYADKDKNQTESNNAGAISMNFTQNEVQCPYVSENTMDKLSDHTKCMLRDLSTSTNLHWPSVKTEDISTTNNITGEYFPEMHEQISTINESCTSSMLNSNNNLLKSKEYSPKSKGRLLELINLCQVKQNVEIINEDSDKITEKLNCSNDEFKTNQDEKIESFLEDTSVLLKIPSLNNSKSHDGNCLIDFEGKETEHSKFIDQNMDKDMFSDESCLTKHKEDEKIKPYEIENCKMIPKYEVEVDSLIDLGDAPTILEFKHDETSTLYLDSAIPSSSKEIENLRLVSDSIESKKLNNILEDDGCASYTQFSCNILSENDEGHSMGFETEHCKQLVKLKQDNKEGRILKNQNLKDTLRLRNNLTGDNLNFDKECLAVPEQFQSTSTHENLKDCNLSANLRRPLYSAQEKIMRLGLEDRITKFEKSRHVALLPDVRLQPSVTDNEKMSQILNQGAKFEIIDKEIQSLYATCIFSHVESPSEFYIHLDDEESQLIDCLNDMITQHYRKTYKPYRSKFETFEKIGKFCCAYVKDDKTYYRAEVLDWLFDKDTKIVLVQLVDYGNITLVHYKHLRELTKDFSILPKMAVKCYLPMLYPPGSTEGNIFNEWPVTSIEALRDLGGLCNSNTKIFYKIFYAHKEGEYTGVDMYEVGNDELNSVGQLLIDLGHAVQIILPSDDPMGVVSDDKDIQRLEECDNINEVVLGYDPKDEGRICKFTKKNGTCFKGKNCKLEHLQFSRGGYTTDHTLTFCSANREIALPQLAESVALRFTVFIEASHYYINLMEYADDLVRLETIINDKQRCATYHQYKIMPAFGEIVLVKHWCKRWMRGRVRHHFYDDEGNCSGVQVFMVDYGDVIDVCLKDIRHIKPEYLELPFQAVECNLYNYKSRNDVDIKQVDKFFYDNMFFREFIGQVMGRSNILLLKVLHKNRDIGQILIDHGFLTKVGTQFFPSDSSIVIPG